MSWFPKRSFAETDALLCAPGSIHEIETSLIDDRLYRVYKNLWPSLRDFWLSALSQYSTDTYIVYQDQRLTYNQVHTRAINVADMLRQVYGIKKGDRIGICSRNCPDYLITFWACHLIGAVSVLANAWLPIQPLRHCLVNTECKLVFLDDERAQVLEPLICDDSVKWESKFLVFGPRREWPCLKMECYDTAVNNFSGNITISSLVQEVPITPEDNATIIFTSGTTGLPKGVLSTQRQFLTNVFNVLVGGCRAALRRGDDFPVTNIKEPQKATLVAVPLFHVTGSTSFSMMATMTGMKIVLTRKWDTEEGEIAHHIESWGGYQIFQILTAVRLIKKENVSVAGGVPAMVSDLIESSLAGHPLEGLLFGGAPAPDSLVPRARKAFPTALMIQGYGLTETNSIAVSGPLKFAGEDYIFRPNSTGRPSPVNDIRIVQDGKCLPAGAVGEVWLRGPNVMKGYWRDPEATRKVITDDGWLRTGDLGYLDEEGFLYIKDRLKDIIIRGGENIDSISVENALYADPRVLEAAVVGVPDVRLGELVAAVVSIKPAFQATVTEAALISEVRNRLPRFAVPVMVVVLNKPFGSSTEEHTPSGKIIKGELRKIARQHWELRQRSGAGREPLVNL